MTARGAARFWLRGLISAGLVAAALMTGAGAASAHTVFEGSEPPDGATMSAAPRTASLDFSSDVDLGLARVQLVDGAGHHLVPGALSVDPTRPTRLLVPLPALPAETYRLSFSVRDSVDLHVTESSIVFGVGRVTSLKAARPPSPGPDPAEVVLRWIARSGLAIVLGALAVSLLVVPSALGRSRTGRHVERRLLSLAMVGVVVATAGDTALLALQASQIGPLRSTFSRLLTESDFGRRWMIGVQLSVGVLLVLAWLRRQTSGRQTSGRQNGGGRSRSTVLLLSVVACLIAAAEAVTVGLSGHTGSSATPTPMGVALRGAHLVAVGAWVGGLLALAVAWHTVARYTAAEQLDGQPNAQAARAALLRRFSPVAAGGLIAVVVTGLLLTGDQVATVTALLTTWYGLTLVVKVLVVVLVAALGIRHARLLRSRRPDADVLKRLRRTLPIEMAGGLVLIVLGAALGATAPARGPQFGPKPIKSPSAITASSGDLILRVSLEPNRPGRNLLSVDVLNTRRPAPAPIQNVTVMIRPSGQSVTPTVIKATPVSAIAWDGGAVNLVPGSMTVDVSVARPDYLPARAVVPWSVNGPDVWRRSPVLSTAHMTPIVNGAAVAVAVLALAVLLLSWWVARRRAAAGWALASAASAASAGSAGGDPVADVADRLDQVAAEFAAESPYVHVDDVAARVE